MRNPKRKIPLTRRSFMARSACASMGVTGIVNTLAHLKLIQGALANSTTPVTDYRALIVLFQFGGTDMSNVLMPGAGHPSRANYDAHRGVLALPTGGTNPVHPITAANLAADPSAPAGAEFFALHPSAPDLKTLFDDGDLCFAANVGTLVVPTTSGTYNSVALPPQLFSHSDQQNEWQSSIPDKPFQSGWCGRIADFLNDQNPDSKISMSVSLAGVNDIQVGLTQGAPQYSVTNTGAISLNGYGTNYANALSDAGDPTSYRGTGGSSNTTTSRRLKAFQDIMNYTHDHIFEEGYNGVVRRARENEGFVGNAIAAAESPPHPDVKFPNGDPVPVYDGIFFLQNRNTGTGNPIVDAATMMVSSNNLTTVVNQMPSLARQLLMITKLMAGRQCLDNKRQIFFCSYGGHDTHQDQGGYSGTAGYVEGDLDENMRTLNDALKAFNDCMKALESREAAFPAGEKFTCNDFILASHSDFNRTFTPNGIVPGPSGSDHAWGTHVFAMGGDVKGGNVFGYYPDLDPTGVWGTPGSSRGRWIPTTAVEQFAAPLARWLGKTDSGLEMITGAEVETIFPNLERFSDPFTAGYDPTDYDSMLVNAHMNYIHGI